MNKILFIGAHPDDETSCTGLFIKAHKMKIETHILICSEGKNGQPNINETSMIKDKIIENRKKELEKYAKNIKVTSCHILNNQNEFLNKDELTLEILKKIRKIQPDIVITHMGGDYHIDHQIIHNIVKNAFEISHRSSFLNFGKKLKGSILLGSDGLELINNPEFYVDISNFLKEKEKIIRNSYNSRLGKLIDVIFYRSKMRGARKGISAAECFNIIRTRSVSYTPKTLNLLSKIIS